MRGLLFCVVLAASCGDNTAATPPGDGAPPPDSPPGAIASCLERPTDLPRPSTQLPCELLPPGFEAAP